MIEEVDMKVIVATRQGQGQVPGDYCWTVEGELVRVLTQECGRPEQCGCHRGFPGLASSRATTTVMVAELALELAAVIEAVRDSLEREGWLEALDEAEQLAEVVHHVSAIAEVAAGFATGTVLRRVGTKVFA